ncbi:MAG: hypothetical protein U1F67_24115 [Rubrivivax sp.]
MLLLFIDQNSCSDPETRATLAVLVFEGIDGVALPLGQRQVVHAFEQAALARR